MNQLKIKPIAYLANRFPYLSETFVYREVTELGKRGIHVRTFSITKPRNDELSQEAIHFLDETFYVWPLALHKFFISILYCFFTRPLKYIRTFMFIMTRKTNKLKNKFRTFYQFYEAVYLVRQIEKNKIQHLHTHFAAGASNVAMILSRLTGITFSFTAHAFEIFSDQMLLKEKLMEAKFVVTISQYNKNYLLNIAPEVKENKIFVIHCGIDTDIFYPEEKNEKNISPIIISVGELKEKKGFPYLIEACSILAKKGYKFQCIVLGSGREEANLKNLIDKLKLQNHVQLKGSVFQENILHYYNKADVFVLPCIECQDGNRDGIPVVLMEAMAMKIPVVSTYVSGIPELIQHKKSGLLVSQKDPEALANALTVLLEDRDLRRKMGKYGRDKVIKDFNIKNNTDELEMLFKKELRCT